MLVNNTEQTHSLGAVMKCACLLILFAFGVDVYAQSYNASNSYRVGGYTQPTASSQQFGGYGVANNGYEASNAASGQVLGYRSYQPTVFEPFDNTPPSESGNSNSGPKGISGRKNGFPGRPDTPPAPGSPVGEPLVLLLFAAVTAVVVAWRQKKHTQAL